MIQIDELKFSYRGHCVYDGLNLELTDGALYGLMGRNGAGKTTLMKLIAGLLRCKEGRISVDGMKPSDRKPEFLDNVYFVPESFNAPDIPVIEYAGSYGMFYSNYDGDAMLEYLSVFGIEPQAVFRKLSAGQKKLSEHVRPDRTIVLSTHQIRDVADIVDHITVIDCGKLLLNCTLEDISSRISFHIDDKAMQNSLFCERTAAGTVNILPYSESADSGRIDLEVLFNACISGGKKFTEYLQKNNGTIKEV